MRHVLLLFVFFCLLLSVPTGAATVNGYVTNSWTAATSNGLVVTVADSLGAFSLTSVTSSGSWSVTIPSTYSYGRIIVTASTGCPGGGHRSSYLYSGSNITDNFQDCSNPPIAKINGVITPSINTGTVLIISKTYDPSTGAHILTAVDSIELFMAGGRFFKRWFTGSNYAKGTLLLKAIPKDPSFANYLPTYSFSSAKWNGAVVLPPGSIDTLGPYASSGVIDSITLIPGINPGGPGFVGGSVLLGANKTAAVGDPISNRTIILKSTTLGNIVSYTNSDASGHFAFSNIPYDTYEIFGDAPGKLNPYFTVTISPSAPIRGDITFEENDTKFFGHYGGLGMNTPNAIDEVRIYPNPVQNFAELRGLSVVTGKKHITLSDVAGRILFQEDIAATRGAYTISTGSLPMGIYTLQLQTENGNRNYRIVK